MKRLLYQTIKLVLPTNPIKRLHDLLWGHDLALSWTPAVNSEWRPVEFKRSQQWDVPGFCMIPVPQVLLSEWSWMGLELTHSATTEGGAKISRGRLDTLAFSWVFLLHTFLQRCLTNLGAALSFLETQMSACLVTEIHTRGCRFHNPSRWQAPPSKTDILETRMHLFQSWLRFTSQFLTTDVDRKWIIIFFHSRLCSYCTSGVISNHRGKQKWFIIVVGSYMFFCSISLFSSNPFFWKYFCPLIGTWRFL